MSRRRVRDLPAAIAGMSEWLSQLSADEATVKNSTSTPIRIDGRAYLPKEVSHVLGERLDGLPTKVQETTRVALGSYRGLTFGLASTNR